MHSIHISPCLHPLPHTFMQLCIVMPFLLQVSNKIYAALLPRIGRLQVVLDSKESLLAVYQLLMTMSPQTISVEVCQ